MIYILYLYVIIYILISYSKRTYAKVQFEGETEYEMKKYENGLGDNDDVIMFYNTFSPPTSYEIGIRFKN